MLEINRLKNNLATQLLTTSSVIYKESKKKK